MARCWMCFLTRFLTRSVARSATHLLTRSATHLLTAPCAPLAGDTLDDASIDQLLAAADDDADGKLS